MVGDESCSMRCAGKVATDRLGNCKRALRPRVSTVIDRLKRPNCGTPARFRTATAIHWPARLIRLSPTRSSHNR